MSKCDGDFGLLEDRLAVLDVALPTAKELRRRMIAIKLELG